MTVLIAKNTTASDTFESNYSDPLGITQEFIRELSESTDTVIETNIVFPNSASRLVIWHIENPDGLDWIDGVYSWALRSGAVGDAAIVLDQVFIRRVSADGLTVRASISSADALGLTMPADTTHANVIDDSGGTLNPGGKAADDHIVIIFELVNTSIHGGDDTTSVEQNLSSSTRLLNPDSSLAFAPAIINSGLMI